MLRSTKDSHQRSIPAMRDSCRSFFEVIERVSTVVSHRCEPFVALMSTIVGTAFVLAAYIGVASCCNNHASSVESESEDALISQGVAEPGVREGRCVPIGIDEYVGPKSVGDIDELLPFATEIGNGVSYEGGFAAGALRQEGGGTSFAIVMANREASEWKTVSAGVSHGEAQAPRVFARGDTLAAAFLVPQGVSRVLRLARVFHDGIRWGAEFPQGYDESLAFDAAIGPSIGIVVWDDVLNGRKNSSVVVGTFDPVTLTKPSKPVVVSPNGTDAETPMVVERDGGFWLFWLARRSSSDSGSDAREARYAAEGIDYRWIEAMPLDQYGRAAGSPTKISPSDGHVLGYDVVSLGDGSAMVVWRDDDTPSGSDGGVIYSAVVQLGGVTGPEQIENEQASAGGPIAMPGWLAVVNTQSVNANGGTYLAPMSVAGRPTDELAREYVLGAGEPIAVRDNDLLVSRPSGTAARLQVFRCRRDAIDAGTVESE